MFTVFGVSGNTGSAVARTLLEHGRPVRVVVREAAKGTPWQKRGAEVLAGSLDDSRSVETALRECEGAYLLLPPDWSSSEVVKGRAARTDILWEVLARVKPERIVFLSSYASYNFGELYAEQKFGSLAGVTFLRASYFMNNWGAVLPAVQADGVLPTFLPPGRKVPMIWADDIGVAAAKLLMAAALADRLLEITGPDEYSSEDVAGALSAILGKRVSTAALSNDAVVPTFTQMGISKDFAELFRRFYADIDGDRIKWERPETLLRGATTIESALRRMLNVQ